MRFPAKLIIPAVLGLLGSSVFAQITATVMPVREREATLALAEQLLADRSSEDEVALNLQRDPFQVMLANASLADTPVLQAAPTAPRYNDLQVLEAIAPRVNPTGTVQIGGLDFLLFGQKRLKVGEMLTITYEGSVYLIEIASIERNNFRIRLNSEELVRPIK